ncbi:uncharacterized protein LOC120262983 [Dioscorea cayenensis subsp. rotundata]|uniref:Uncharacterized protein LOC120262983 n=1 Tax=Dioscorea cayennensis subsp. rotundata TaxID=55577 RepID=A0AB40BJP1_DIOCR|nr:uncharacterized protein LOC120262983 [Dioscorea cayenensis subsp. rotundata]
MARGRGRGWKLVIQKDFPVVDGFKLKDVGDVEEKNKKHGAVKEKSLGGEACDQVLMDGPFTFDNHLLVLKKWHPRLNVDTNAYALPIWIQLPGLPWKFWTKNMLSKIGSVCGNPLYCDKCTLSKVKLGYARILMEMDSSGDFPEMIDPYG